MFAEPAPLCVGLVGDCALQSALETFTTSAPTWAHVAKIAMVHTLNEQGHPHELNVMMV